MKFIMGNNDFAQSGNENYKELGSIYKLNYFENKNLKKLFVVVLVLIKVCFGPKFFFCFIFNVY
jgi:hypothetical protein